MTSIIISLITIGAIVYGLIEYYLHHKNLATIPIRIHVNGTRGKSSVTRLIGAGLRAGGYNTITKVTGTFPRMILGDGTEVVVPRKGKANILEQLNVVKFCADKKTNVLLIECMALQPNYQRITEHQMVKATHGVITNIRLDHLEIMGPRLKNVAEALSLTVPKNSKLFTAENRMTDFLKNKARKLNTEFIPTKDDTLSKEEMEGFTYLEHSENVALALAICKDLKVDRKTALNAMKKSIPDEGVLRKFTYKHRGLTIHFYNAFAANDPESSLMIWKNIQKTEGADKQYLIILNSRKDRKERSQSFIYVISMIKFDNLVLTGENTKIVSGMALKRKISKDKIIEIGIIKPEEQVNNILKHITKNAVIVAFGNMGAGGSDLSKYFEIKHIL